MLLDNHLNQITSSARSIGDLYFPPPKIFTNALLSNAEITTLIRDTEPHERALFSVDSSILNGLGSGSRRPQYETHSRRKTQHITQHRQSSAVAKVLGNDMLRQIQQSSRTSGRAKGVDIEVLLQGAERLSSVYTVPGASERILALRKRYRQITTSTEMYEAKIVQRQQQLKRLNASSRYDDHSEEDGSQESTLTNHTSSAVAEMNLKQEEEEIRELEAKKKALEHRVAEMEKDLGGLLR